MERHVRRYFRETTIHGFRYVVEGRNSVEKLSWSVVVALCIAYSAVLVQRSLQEASLNPITTSVESIPVETMTFPAVTIRPGLEHDHYRFLLTVLNSLEFDCLDKGPECSAQSQELKLDVNFAIQKLIYERLYPKVLRGLVDENGLSFDGVYKMIEIICQSSRMFEGEGGNALWRIAQAIQLQETEEMKMEMLQLILQLAIQSFRIPIGEFIERVTAFSYKYVNNVQSSNGVGTCWSRYSKVDPNTTAIIFTLIESQGGLNRPLGLGNLFKDGYYAVWKQGHLKENELMALAKFQMAFNWLLEGTELTISQLFSYFKDQDYVDLSLNDNPNSRFDCPISKIVYTNNFSSYCNWQQEDEKGDECCHLEREIQTNYQTALGIFKYMLQPPTRRVREKSELQNIAKAIEFLGYPTVETDNGTRLHIDPAIIACQFGTLFPLTKNCELFVKTFSTGGVAYTFNAAEFFGMYQENENMKAFFEEMHETLDDGLEDVHGRRAKTPFRTEFSGPAYGLEVYIRHNAFTGVNLYGKVEFAIHPPKEPGDLRNQPIELQAGSTYNIFVTPSEVETDAHAMESLGPEIRACFSAKERKLNLFKDYTQSNCLFECQLHQAISKCGCVDLDFPNPYSNISFCHAIGTTCFKKVLSETSSFCDCPSDCSSTSYQYHVVTQTTNVGIVCKTIVNDVGMDFARNDLYTLASLEEKAMTDLQLCHKELQENIAVLKVFMGSRFANKIIRTARVTFTGQLASLGGVVGLFTGMSIISLFEIIFWVLRMLKDLFPCPRTRQRPKETAAKFNSLEIGSTATKNIN